MFGNYLRTALRSLWRHKGISFMNIAGLAVGMAVCMLILVWVLDELSYDRCHEKSDRIYRLCNELTIGGTARKSPSATPPMGPAIVRDYPEVVDAVRISRANKVAVRYEDKQFFEEGVLYADNSIFNVLTFPLISGDPQSALTTAYSVVMTETMATKYFGEEDAIGRTVRFDGRDDFTVTGVVEDVPSNSHITFDMLCSFETLYAEDRQGMEMWGRFGFYTYLLLGENVDPNQLQDKLPDLIAANLGERLEAVGASVELFLQPLLSIHLYSSLPNDILDDGGDIDYVYLFSGIALSVLLAACINFVNLTTARSTSRAREVGMRKTLGAHRGRLVRQFLGESVLHSLLAVALACLLVELFLPMFNLLSGRVLSTGSGQVPWLILGALGLALGVGLVAGCYPALLISSFHPVQALKGALVAGVSGSRFRRVLVVTQFTVCVALVIGTITIAMQIDYMTHRRLGFDKEQVVVVRNISEPLTRSIASLRNELSSLSGISDVAWSSTVPGAGGIQLNFIPEGYTEEENQLMTLVNIDDHWLSTFGVELVAGRNFSVGHATDPDESAIINETAARLFGWENPIGKTIRQRVRGPSGPEWTTKTVIGVVRDFHMASLHQEVGPIFIGNSPRTALTSFNTISVRIASGYDPHTIELLKSKFAEIDPDLPFDYYFLDESLNAQYETEQGLRNLTLGFSLLAIFVGCLGLVGLSSYAAEQRTKEVGIRKALGASVSGITLMLGREFIILVAIANVLAWPIAFYVMDRWLEDFAYRITLGMGPFVLAGLLTLVIALATVSFQALKAARANPVEALRCE